MTSGGGNGYDADKCEYRHEDENGGSGDSGRRDAIFKALKTDQVWHPINKKPQSGNTATNRKWIESQSQWLASEKN